MKSWKAGLAAVVAAGVALAPSVAQAQFTTFTSFAAWSAAVSNPGLDTFNDLAIASTPSPLNRTTTGTAYNYRATSVGPGSNLFFPAGNSADPWLSNNSAVDDIVFDNFSASVRGIGGLFFGSDINGSFLPGITINIAATNAGGTFNYTIPNSLTTSFFGVVSSGAITSFRIGVTQTPGVAPSWVTANDLRLAAAPAVVIPEPSTYALLATGLVALGVAARRRRRA
jgi:hypothetical protein